MLLFEIHDISYGWFEVGFEPYKKAFFLVNSDYLGCDAPKLFLNSMGNLLEKKSTNEWLCWQDEPGANILHLTTLDNKLIVEVFNSDKDSFDLPYYGEILKSHITECQYCDNFEFSIFLDNVVTEFSLYENGNGLLLYKEHWGEFPQDEFNKLKKYAFELNKTRGTYDEMFCLSYLS